MWLVLKSESQINFENNNPPYKLMESDIIKFGRRKYEVLKLNIPIAQGNEYEENSLNSINQKYGQVFNKFLKPNQYCKEIKELNKNNNLISDKKINDGYNEDKDCRICFGSESTKENPKLRICRCKTFIHYKCLKMFLQTHIKMSENQKGTVTSYHHDKFNCEVCEEPFSLYYKFIEKNNNKNYIKYSLIDGINQPKNFDYMILESLTFIKKNKNIKNIFVIKLTDRELNIGRHTDNDIIDNDMTISRYHAILKYNKDNGHITITNKSKFGVLLLIKDNVKLNIDQKIFIQMGKTYLSAEVKDSSNNKYNYENEDNGYTIFDENYISKNNKDDVTRDKSEMQTDNNSINIGNTINADF
jgi:pSer/pThr/pTyr-binding forkhead associated (FHA) protein